MQFKLGNTSLKVAYAFLALMLSLPFLLPWHRLPIPSFYSESLAIVLGLCVGFAISIWTIRQERTWNFPRVIVLPLTFLVIVSAQWVAGYFAYTTQAVIVFGYFLWLALLMCVGHTLAKYDREIHLPFRSLQLISLSLLFGGLLSGLIGFMQYFGVPKILQPIVNSPVRLDVGVFGNIAQQNHFASYLALALCSVFYLRSQKTLTKIQGIVVGLILIFAMFLSASRSVYLHCLWILVVFFFKGKLRWRWIIILLCSVVVFGCFLSWLELPQLRRDLQLSETIGVRFYLWEHAWEMFKSQPIFGVGFNNFAFQFVQQLAITDIATLWGIDQYAHNLFLQILAVSGLLGFLGLTIPLVRVIRSQVREPLTSGRTYMIACLGVLSIHSMLEQPLYYSYFLGIAALLLGYIDVSTCALSRLRKFNICIAVVLPLMLVLVTKTGWDFYLIESTFFSREKSVQSSDETDYKVIISSLNHRTLLQADLEAIMPSEFVSPNAPTLEKLVLNKRLMHSAPVDEVMFRHAALLAENGDTDQAKRQFQMAALAYPDKMHIFLPRFIWMAEAEPQTYAELAQFAQLEVQRIQFKLRISR